ncbi:MAG: thermopsin family protease [Thermoplasmata archaeon]|nr:thermopsin family protease [Thermoplasmata archaeon]
MTALARGLVLVAVAFAAIMLIPSGALGAAAGTPHVASAAHTPASAAVPTHATAATVNPTVQKALTAIRENHIPTRDVLLPNINSHPSVVNGVVQPLYSAAPAPMGLGYFGVHKSGGVNVGTISYTKSVEAVVHVGSVDPFLLSSTSPDYFTLQLNTVATNVDVLGNTSGQYWIQNVPVYQASTGVLYIEDNIWNFSSPTAGMQTSTLYSYSGQVVPGVFYYTVGPAFYMPTPFTIALWNNASVVNNRPTIFFNYSITAANGTNYQGSYDQVEFNSSALAHPPRAPMPVYQINGKATNPLGLLNDAEVMIGGPGGGTTTTLLGIDATMGLWTLPNGSATYKVVPAGSSFGTDTGETSEGIAEWTAGGTNPVAVLGGGPSLLQPLWGLVGTHSGSVKTTLTVTPSNAFVFAWTGGSFSTANAAWAPFPAAGTATFQLPPGTYTWKILLSDYRAVTSTVSASSHLTVNLVADASKGVYTPLWAWNNAQLAAISQAGGTGTVTHPYVLDNNGVGPISPLFGEFNDFFFPVFPGLFLADTTAYVTASGLPDFAVSYSLPAEGAEAARFGTPLSNNLQLQVYNAEHVSLVNNPQITGWGWFQNSFQVSALFWHVSDSLIAGNGFQVQSQGLYLSVGGTNNVVWGNDFSAATTTAANPGTIANGGAQIGFEDYESGDLIYNNAFTTPFTAATPGFDLYTGGPGLWTDRWNVALQAATNTRTVNGWVLSGNILGLHYEGGNYWGNYGSATDPFGVLPYNDGGAISVGGDQHPLTPFTLTKVIFRETGLPPATAWTVTLNGITKGTTGHELIFWEPAGTYAYTVGAVAGHTASPSSGAAIVGSTTLWVHIAWT